ncbi:MAG: hypothetical protein ACLR60_07785 [Clostridium paraputrificum]
MRRNSYKCTSDTKEKLLSATIKLVKEKGVKIQPFVIFVRIQEFLMEHFIIIIIVKRNC